MSRGSAVRWRGWACCLLALTFWSACDDSRGTGKEAAESRLGEAPSLRLQVERMLRCRPEGERICGRRGGGDPWVDRSFPWVRVLAAFEGEEGIEILAGKQSIEAGIDAFVPYSYRIGTDGRVTGTRCLGDLPEVGSAIVEVRAPDVVESDGSLVYYDGCSLNQVGWKGRWGGGSAFRLEGGRLAGGERRSDSTHGHRIFPRSARDKGLENPELDQAFLPAFVPVPVGPLRAVHLALIESAENVGLDPLSGQSVGGTGAPRAFRGAEGWGWVAAEGVFEFLHLVDRSRSDHPSRLAPLRSQRMEWIRKMDAEGSAGVEPLRAGDSLRKKAVLLGDGSELHVEAGGIAIALQAHRRGAWLEFHEDPSLNRGWASLAAALKRQGWEGAILWNPPLAIAGERLYRVGPEGAELLCARLWARRGCVGACRDLSAVGPGFGETSLFLPYVGGVMVGRCLDGEEER